MYKNSFLVQSIYLFIEISKNYLFYHSAAYHLTNMDSVWRKTIQQTKRELCSGRQDRHYLSMA